MPLFCAKWSYFLFWELQDAINATRDVQLPAATHTHTKKVAAHNKSLHRPLFPKQTVCSNSILEFPEEREKKIFFHNKMQIRNILFLKV